MIRARRLPTRVPVFPPYELEMDGRRRTTRRPMSVLTARLGLVDSYYVVDEADKLWREGNHEQFVEFADSSSDIQRP